MGRKVDQYIRRPKRAAIVVAAGLAGCSSSPPKQLMIDDTHFTPCGEAPHCVSSQAGPSDAHYIEPLTFTGTWEQARADLRAVIAAEDHAEIVTVDAYFLHATFSTTLGFVDDVTLLIRPGRSTIDIKSSSRVGYYDFGVNRRRVAYLRRAFAARQNTR